MRESARAADGGDWWVAGSGDTPEAKRSRRGSPEPPAGPAPEGVFMTSEDPIAKARAAGTSPDRTWAPSCACLEAWSSLHGSEKRGPHSFGVSQCRS